MSKTPTHGYGGWRRQRAYSGNWMSNLLIAIHLPPQNGLPMMAMNGVVASGPEPNDDIRATIRGEYLKALQLDFNSEY